MDGWMDGWMERKEGMKNINVQGLPGCSDRGAGSKGPALFAVRSKDMVHKVNGAVELLSHALSGSLTACRGGHRRLAVCSFFWFAYSP